MPKIVYIWFGLSLALMAAETFMPGAFLLWFGFAAAVMGVLTWLLPEMPPLAQAITFGLLSLVSIWIYRRWFRGREPTSDQPLLNRRVDQMMGHVYELHEPIRNGYGKIKVNDALWTVHGADLPAGTRVVVTGASGMTLQVSVAT
ncbi:MAG TPA: NfeD family protein [Candidatus Saccharimonadia bacterium]|nr:NfeD family protein [Candidatus Saccharimonadia bacterium]